MKRLAILLTTLFLAGGLRSRRQVQLPPPAPGFAAAALGEAQLRHRAARRRGGRARTRGSVPVAQPTAPQAGSDWFWGKPIASVQWEGIVHADKRELDSATKSYIGKNFTEELWMEIQSKLFELDWFEKIDPTALPSDASKSGVTIKFKVVEKPAIASVRVIGNSGYQEQRHPRRGHGESG